MRITFLIFFLFLSIGTLQADCSEKLDVKSQSFIDLGKYIETLEINQKEANIEESVINEREDIFENEAIKNVAQRYEENAIELKLDEIDDNALDVVNNDRVFKLKVNETQYNIEQNIKTENMYCTQ